MPLESSKLSHELSTVEQASSLNECKHENWGDLRLVFKHNYDLIGDIHGHAKVLRRLLQEMGYRDDSGIFRHQDRRVIFVGDFVDRGPDQQEVLRIARSMCEAGTALAVMGNHEFNALGWAEPDGTGGFLRPHTPNNKEQHQEFLRQIGEGSAAHR